MCHRRTRQKALEPVANIYAARWMIGGSVSRRSSSRACAGHMNPSPTRSLRKRLEHRCIKGSLGPRRLPFGPGTEPVSHVRPVIRNGRWKERPAVSLSCRLSATGIRFLDHPVPPGSWAFLTVGLPDRRPDPEGGFHVPHGRDPTGEGALCTPGPRCSHDRLLVTGRRCRISAASPALGATSHPRGFRCRGINESSLAFTRPAFPLPVAPGWSGRPWAFPLMLRTPPLPAKHVKVGTGPRTLTRNSLCSYMLDPPISEPLITVRPRVATRRPNCCRKGLRTTPDKSAGQHRFWAGPYARFFGCGGVTTIDSQQTAGWPRAEPYPAHPQGSARRRGVLPRSTKSPAN